MRLVFQYCTCLLAVALSSVASAQQPYPSPTSQPEPPPSAPPPPPVATDAPIIRPYATIKPTFIVSSAAIESFGQPNASAATAAGNPVLAAMPDEAFITFQSAQSRLGFWFDEKGPARGHFEMDFLDVTKSSPTVASLPRLRIASVDWQLSPSVLLSAGQDWDLYAPLNPYTLNIAAVAFQGGNTGFMRQQAKLVWHNEGLELGAAVGLAGVTNGFRLGAPELGKIPTLAVRAAALFGKAGRLGISGIATRWRFAPGAANERKAFAGAANLYGDLTPAEGFNVRFEAYLGQNLANLGSLSLGNGSPVNDIKEVGGFLSAKYNLNPAHALYMLAGIAQVLDDDKVVPSYVYPAQAMPAMAPPLTSTSTVGAAGPGILWNQTARLGYEYRYSKALAVMAEGFAFHTKHALDPMIDAPRFDAVRTALGGELGLLLTL
jgi:hypothetical protein